MSTASGFLVRLQVVEACLTSAAAATRLGRPGVADYSPERRLQWLARAEASLDFAAAELTFLQSSAGRRLLRSPAP